MTRTGNTALLLICSAITMFFTALTSAAMVRRGLSGDWQGIPVPALLYLNSAILIASSFYRPVLLGTLFLIGQLVALLPLSISASPGHSFFFVFTVAHGIHVAGGLVAHRFAPAELARRYWHFLTGLWIYLMLLFILWANR